MIKLQASERAAIQLRAAEFKANATKITLAKEGETYRAVMETLNLTPEVRTALTCRLSHWSLSPSPPHDDAVASRGLRWR